MQRLPEDRYLPRVLDSIIDKRLSYSGAVEIRGPKWCGKTQCALQHANSSVMMQNPDRRSDYQLLANTKPSLLLEGDRPRLIDEWQEAPQLWDAVRFSVDELQEPGQYLLTGSATPTSRPSHSGTGRIVSVDMLPMSLSESGDSTDEVSFSALFDEGAEIAGKSECDVEQMSYLVCRGGWPRAVTSKDPDAALEMAFDYVTAIAEQDISRADGIERNAQYARLIMREYARCITTQTSQSAMLRDIRTRDIDLSRDTVNGYLAALRKLYVIQELSAWTPSLHARARITKTPVRHFSCPSIAAAALGASPASLLRDTSTLGMLFESLCVRDLRVYAQAIKGEVFHYHDQLGAEADSVVSLRDGRYALFEMKLGASYVEEGVKTLVRVSRKIDQSVMGPPTFMAVIVPGGYAYRRDDGILVLPITCLTA